MRNWNKLYATYVSRYLKKQTAIVIDKLSSKLHGETNLLSIEDMYSKRDFIATYTALEADRMEEIKQGTRKVANITQDLVNRQVEYKYSYKQAKVIQNQLNELYGEKISIQKIRKGVTGEFWEDVRQKQSELKANGVHGTKMNAVIAQEFFGS